MSEELFELYLDGVSNDIDAHAFANKLSPLLGVDSHQLEKKLVKVKLLHGRSEVIKSGLTEEKAARLEKLLNSWGLMISVKAEWALLPIEEIETTDSFICPSCGLQQDIEVEKMQICSECGVVKEKYEALQKRKALAVIQAKQQKLIEQGAKEKKFTSIEQRNRDFLDKKRKKEQAKSKKRINVAALSMSILVFLAIISTVYMYSEVSQTSQRTGETKSVTESSGDVDTNNPTEMATTVDASTSSTTEAAVSNDVSASQQVATTASSSPSSSSSNSSSTATKSAATAVAPAASIDDQTLGVPENPYSKLVNGSSLPPISMEDAPKYVNKLLKKNKKKLPEVDAKALGNISTLYDEIDESQQETPDFKEIKKIANSVSDQDVRGALIKQASWQEMGAGVKTFDDFGIRSIQRAGEENAVIASLSTEINRYVKDYQYKKAANVARQIKEPYLQAVALNKIMDSQFYLDLTGAKQQRDKIKEISSHHGLTPVQKTLVLGLVYQADRRLGHYDVADVTFKRLQFAIDDLKSAKEQVVTLIQLAEDQREGLNFTDAQNFLDASYQQISKLDLNAKESDQLHGMLAQGYAKLFEFGRANTLLTNIKNGQKKSQIANTVALIAKKAAL